MSQHGDPSLAALPIRLRFFLREPIDFARTDSESTHAKVRLLTAAALYFKNPRRLA